MHITLVVDALAPQLSGIGRYTWELCRRLPAQPGIERVSYFSNGCFLDDPAIRLYTPTVRKLRLPRWIQAPSVERRLRESLVHSPNYFLPSQADTGIITIHDLSVLRFPDTHPAKRVRQFERNFDSSLRRARHMITDTKTVRSELIAAFNLPQEQISVIPLGVSSDYRPRTDMEIQSQLKKWELSPQGYALCVSTLEPRKKIAELLRAWSELPANIRGSTPLALAGAEGWLNESLHEQIRSGVTAGWLKYLGFVPEADLPALYAGATLFLYPSIYEGFGLPPIEAMASGVPVVVANSSCLPEVCGNAAAYIDPDDISGFGIAIMTTLSDVEWRDQARERGLMKARSYTWDSCAKQTAEVYRNCC